MKHQIERRRASMPVEVRSAEGEPTVIRGYAAVFGTEAVIAGLFRERIDPGAFRAAVKSADIRATFNHDENFILGRTTNGTLRLIEDERGLAYEIDPNMDDPSAVGVLAKLKRGDVTGSSFGFRVKEGGDEWTRPSRASELPLRVIKEYEFIKDVGPVSFPAFDETTAEARSSAEAARATASGLTPDAAEEQAELVQYQALKDMLDQLTALIAKATPTVEALIADESESPTETIDEEAAEEDIEQARLNVLRALGSQLCGAASGFQSLVCGLSNYGYGYYSAAIATERARVDLLALDE